MKRLLSIAILTLGFSVKAQSQFASIGGTLGGEHIGQIMKGVEFEYGVKISPKFILTAGAEFTRYNDFPSFANRGDIGGGNLNKEVDNYIRNNIKGSQQLWSRVNQQIYTIGVNFSPFGNEKHEPYIRTGLGINVQDALSYSVESIKNKSITEDYKNVVSQRSASTLVVIPAVGYNFHFNNKWALGTHIDFQLPLARSNNYFKYGGAGFDEYLKIGFKIVRKF